MSDQLRERLENWGKCQRSGGRPGSGQVMPAKETRRPGSGGQGYKCMTEVICNGLRMAAEGERAWNGDRSKLDYEDAYKVNAAWVMLKDRQKTMLKLCFVDNEPPNVICRKLNILHWPAEHFKDEFYTSMDAMGAMLLRLRELRKE